ncbi:MAG: glycerol kinase GlpK [Bacteroidota bacterium]
MKYFLGIDQGTTGTTSIVFDEEWNICGKGYFEHKQYYPKPGWVEHDPEEIWKKTKESVAEALSNAKISAGELDAIGLANQGETCMAWDKKTGKPVYNAIVWQDRRGSKQADELKEAYGDLIMQKTGLTIDAYFSALKIKWILENVPGTKEKAEKGDLLVGTLDTWLLWKMTAERVYITDSSTASRTMLFNIHTNRWDDEILDIIGIPVSLLPGIKTSAEIYGTTDPGFLDAPVPIAGSVVDQPAALFGQACFDKGAVKTTYGTGCFMLMNTGEKPVYSNNGLLTAAVWSLNGKLTYALDGGVYIGGAAIQWLRDGIGIINHAGETEALARSVPDSSGLYFVPAFSGLAAPYWDQYTRGTMVGITGGTSRAHIVRATLEAIAYQVAENLEVMEKDSGIKIETMRADGGAVANTFLMQFQADILGVPVDVPVITETTALGAAYLGALGIGELDSVDSIKNIWKLNRRYMPQISENQREGMMEQWKKAVATSRSWINKE